MSESELAAFVRQVAEVQVDGDPVEGEPDGEFALENDDAWETLIALVHGARELLRST
jgi:hypothetical protein